MRPADTSPEAWDHQMDLFRNMGAERRVGIAVRMTQGGRELAREGIRIRHPEYLDSQVDWALKRLWIGDELFRAAFPNAPMMAP